MTSGRPIGLLVAFLAVAASVGWRRGEYFSGSLDPVVVAKGALTVCALGLAFAHSRSRKTRRRLGTGSLWWLAGVLCCSVFGALTYDQLRAGGIVAVRVALLGAIVFLMLRTAPAERALGDIAWACGSIAVVAAFTGAPSLAEGRLAGGIPALAPNELALLAGIALLVLAWRMVLGTSSGVAAGAGLLLAGILWLTGSRTALLMLVVGVLVMAVHIRRPRVVLVVGSLVLGSLGVLAAALTGAVTAFLERDGTGLSTVESRLVAWRDSLSWADDAWQHVFGGGLAVKIIRVRGQYWDTQPLDSSWVSLLVQAGALGLIVAVAWALWVARGAVLAPRPHRVLFLGLWVFLIGHSTLESGLFDATPAFLCLMALSLLAEGGSRGRLRSEGLLAEADERGVPPAVRAPSMG